MSNTTLKSLLSFRDPRAATGHIYAASSVFGAGEAAEGAPMAREGMDDFPVETRAANPLTRREEMDVFPVEAAASPVVRGGGMGDFPAFSEAYPAVTEAAQPLVVQPEQPREVTVVLELDRQQLARAVYRLNDEESRRVGARLMGGVD